MFASIELGLSIVSGWNPAYGISPSALFSDFIITNADGTLTTIAASGPRGLEVYGEATNLLLESRCDQYFVANGTTPPTITDQVTHLGQSTTEVAFADTLTPGQSNAGAHRPGKAAQLLSGQKYTHSIYIALNRPLVGGELVKMLFSGFAGSVRQTIDAGNSVDFVGQFGRLSSPQSTVVVGSGGVYPIIYIDAPLTSDLTVYVHSGQTELGDFASPWIETTTSSATRAASEPTLVQGYGPELATLANFDKRAETDGTVTFLPDGTLNFVNGLAGLSTAVSEEITGLTVGATYRFTTSVRLISGADLVTELRTGSGGGGADLAQSSFTSSSTFITQTVGWVATQTSIFLSVRAAVGSEFQVESASFAEVLPYPGYATEERLGDEQVENGDFANGLTGYTNITAQDPVLQDGGVFIERSADNVTNTSVAQTTNISGLHEVSYDVLSGSGNLLVCESETIAATVGRHTFQRTFSDENRFSARCFAGANAVIDNITVKPVYRDHTFKVEWDADSVTGDRVVWEGRKDANNRLVLHFVSGILRFESFVSGSSEGFVAVAGVDDGGSHSAVLYWDEVSGTLSLDVDGQGLEGPELVTNGGFDTDSDWTFIGSSTGISSGTALVTDSGAAEGRATQALAIVEGIRYSVAFTILSTVSSGAVTLGGTRTAAGGLGTRTLELIAGSSDNVIKLGTNTASPGSFTEYDNISVKATYTRTGLTLPTNLSQIALGHSGGANQLNGLIEELLASNNNNLLEWV